jgi:hypothetical protein
LPAPPPPFTIGVLTAADSGAGAAAQTAATAVLTTVTSSGA